MNPFFILQAMSAGSDAIGSYFGARTARTNARSQAAISRINARISDLRAKDALMTGQRQEQARRMQTTQQKSAAKVAMAANGIDLGSDVATNLLASTDYVGEVDANAIAANAIKSAWGYQTEASNLRTQGSMLDSQADQISPTLSAINSLIGSASRAAPQWYQMKRGG